MKALVLAAGRGSRLREQTEEQTKCMLPMFGKPLMQYSLENAVRAGATEVVIVVAYRAEQIINRFGIEFEGVRLQYRDTEVGVLELAACHVGSAQQRRPEAAGHCIAELVGFLVDERACAQIRALEIGFRQVGVLEGRGPQVRLLQVGSAQIGTVEVGGEEPGESKVRLTEVRPAEAAGEKLRPGQIHLGEIEPAEVAAPEHEPSAVAHPADELNVQIV